MRIIFSKDRAAQLDLLLRSLERNAPDDDTAIIWDASTDRHREGYRVLAGEHGFALARQTDFDAELRSRLAQAVGFVTFFCDDDVLYRRVELVGEGLLETNDRLLAFSLRLASNGQVCWPWQDFPPHDHGYPGSIDGHTFRVADVLHMIDGQVIDNPLTLETVLAHRCHALAEERPLMAAYAEQCLVGVPVNSVADQRGRPHGDVYPQSAADLNSRYLNGWRIDLDALDFSGVDGCLHEIPFVWRRK